MGDAELLDPSSLQIAESAPKPIPAFKKIPQRSPQMYASHGENSHETIFNAPVETIDPRMDYGEEPQDAYPLIDSPLGLSSQESELEDLEPHLPVQPQSPSDNSAGGGDFVPLNARSSSISPGDPESKFSRAVETGAGNKSWDSAVESTAVPATGSISGIQPIESGDDQPQDTEASPSSSGFPSVPSMLPRATDVNRVDDSSARNGEVKVQSTSSKRSGSTTSPKTPAAPKASPQDSNSINPSNFRLAAQPKEGDSFHPHDPQTDSRAWLVDSHEGDFHPGPIYDAMPYEPYGQIEVYEGKTLNATQRPLLELGRPWYQLGQLPESYDFMGKHNPVSPQLIVFGDFRTAYASNNKVGESDSQIAYEWNMNWDLRLTGTERFAWFLAPMNDGEDNTRYELDNDRYVDRWNADFVFGYFEGDLGAIVGGWTGQTLPFDLPFAVGVMPLLFQNGVWLEDQFLGVAATIPARNVPKLGISNMDVTFFAGYDEILSPAFGNEDDVARLYGIASFIEASNGYWEIDYAYLEDRDVARDRSYHNIGIGYSRRYGRWISNSTRMIVNAGQSTAGGTNTADGVLLLSENSLITANPSTVIPYMNFFAGFDRPQKAAGRDVLRNTGILFESDGMTGYPTLDSTAQNTYGGAIGLNILPSDFSQQLVLETAFVGVMGDQADRNAVGNQYGVGMRYQLPLNNSVILRADAMYGMLEDSEDVNGVRLELRRKF